MNSIEKQNELKEILRLLEQIKNDDITSPRKNLKRKRD